jgi:small subunit ribosomal protein S1
VHISELAAHHVENPREVVAQGQAVNVRILEIDGDRRRLSLSLKRVEEGDTPVARADGAESVHLTPNLVLSEEAFPVGGAVDVSDDSAASDNELEAESSVPEVDGVEDATDLQADAKSEPELEVGIEPEAMATPVDEPEADAGDPIEEAEPETVASADSVDEAEVADAGDPAEEAEPEIASVLDDESRT